MFGIGLWEIVVIFLAIIIFINPKDLPGFFFKVGKGFKQLRDINKTIMHELNEVGREIKYPASEKIGETKMGIKMPPGEFPKEIDRKEK